MRGRGGDARTRRGRPARPAPSGADAAPRRAATEPPLSARAAAARRRSTRCSGRCRRVETRGRVWVYADKQLKPVRLRLGITDGQTTELLEGDLEPGTELVTNVTTGNETRPARSQGGFPPFMGPAAAAASRRRSGGIAAAAADNRGGGGR